MDKTLWIRLRAAGLAVLVIGAWLALLSGQPEAAVA